MENKVVYEASTINNRKLGYIILLFISVLGAAVIVLSMIPIRTVTKPSTSWGGKDRIYNINLFDETVSYNFGEGTKRMRGFNQSTLIGMYLSLISPFSIYLFINRKNALNSKLQLSKDSVLIKKALSFSDKKDTIPLKSDVKIITGTDLTDKIIGGEKLIVYNPSKKYVFRCIDNAEEFINEFMKYKNG